MEQINKLPTEQRNPNTADIDRVSTLEIVRRINDEDKKVAYAVERELENIAAAVDAIASALRAGGRLIYCGCGTSGRLGVLDAAECPPTYSVDPGLVRGIIAGGEDAMFRASEGAEDNAAAGADDLKAIGFNSGDVLVGIAASGRTPYVLGAMSYAKELGACTVAVTCNKKSAMNAAADIAIGVEPGPEVITGSTRMKSGTAEKMVAETGSVAASMEDFTGPTSRMPCMNRVKESRVPNSTMAPTASQPRMSQGCFRASSRGRPRIIRAAPMTAATAPSPATPSRSRRVKALPMTRSASRRSPLPR